LHPGSAANFVRKAFISDAPRLLSSHFSPGNYLSGETRDIEFAGGENAVFENGFPVSIILELVDVPRREFSFVDPPSGRWITVNLTGVPYLTLCRDGGPFLASNLAVAD